MSAVITGKLTNEPQNQTVNTYCSMSSVITGQLPNEPNIHSVK